MGGGLGALRPRGGDEGAGGAEHAALKANIIRAATVSGGRKPFRCALKAYGKTRASMRAWQVLSQATFRLDSAGSAQVKVLNNFPALLELFGSHAINLELSCPATRATAHSFSRILAGKPPSNLRHASRARCSELLGGECFLSSFRHTVIVRAAACYHLLHRLFAISVREFGEPLLNGFLPALAQFFNGYLFKGVE